MQNLDSGPLFIVTIIGAIAAMVYYLWSIVDHLIELARSVFHVEYERFKQLKRNQLSAEPWTKVVWVAEGQKNVKLQAVRKNGIAILLTGLGQGKIRLEFNEISLSELSYRGAAYCAEHGGLIDSGVHLHRRSDNCLELHLALDPRSKKSVILRFVVAMEDE